MTLAALQSAVQALAPTQIDATTATSIINRVYLAYLRKKEWIARRVTSILGTQADKTGGTLTLVNGSVNVTGVGTAFAATDVGRYLYVGAYVPARIQTFAAASGVACITLTSAWGGPNLSGQAVQVTSLRYGLPAGTERVYRIATELWPQGLTKTSRTAIDQYDPTRRWRGSPQYWCEAEIVAGVREIELWPVPSTQDAYTLTTMIRPDTVTALSGAGDIPIVDGVMLQYGAMAEASRMMLGRTGDQAWVTTAEFYQTLADDAGASTMRADSKAKGGSPVVGDSDSATSDLSQFAGLRQGFAYFQSTFT